ncbi:MAG: DNA translocase FtsK 4TM domain-containing protein [bacterium]
MAKKSKKNKSSRNTLRRILSGSAMILLGVWIMLSIFSHSNYDFFPADGFIYPPPRPIMNWGGPAGAMTSNVLINTFGYFAILIPLLLIIWGGARLFLLPPKKTWVVTGELVAGHGILAMLLALPGGTLASAITGNYGAELAETMKGAVGNVGAYIVGIGLFGLFIAAVTRLDFRATLDSAYKGILGARTAFAARKKRKEARQAESREDVIAKYKNKSEKQYNGITGSIIPGENSQDDFDQTPIKRDIEEDLPEPEYEGTASKMEFSFSPTIIRSARERQSAEHPPAKSSDTHSPPPPPPRAEPIDPKKIQPPTEKPIENRHVEPPLSITPEKEREITEMVQQSLSGDDDEIKIGHEAPMPEPIPLDKPGDNIDKPDRRDEPAPKKPTAGVVDRVPDRPKGPYRFTPPGLDLLINQEKVDSELSDSVLRERAKQLIETLRSFKVDGEIREICPGPVITRYELEPAVGVKVSRIANLADDIALALKAQDIRIVAPIPGKGAVGIEVPNDQTETVRLKSVLASDSFAKSNYTLPLALGKRVDGSPAVVDLAKMPHLLIAGATGSGKSVCINTIISSLLYSKSPEDLRLVMIDPKRLELSVYSDIPHLTSPIVVEPKNAALALNWAVEEMDSRYKMLSKVGVRSIAGYNELAKERAEEGMEKLPYVVVLIDELADLMVAVSGEIEEPIARLAQMARAVGIHLVIATQRPSVDVITGLIKANFPSRMAFKVRSKIDSRTILDMGGAERLLGYGDMLYLPSGFAEPNRIHGCLVTTAETERIVKYLRTFPNPFPDRMLDFDEAATSLAVSMERDELFWEAAKIVVMYQQGSTSFLQRKLRVGYTRAGCIIDQLEQAGIVGPFQGSKARDVLLENLDDLDDIMESDGIA